MPSVPLVDPHFRKQASWSELQLSGDSNCNFSSFPGRLVPFTGEETAQSHTAVL